MVMTRRGRFAPTPSGLFHMGNAFSALAAWLQMRQIGGQLLLRIEDIDKPRSRPAFAEQQMNDLRWLGLDWDEGPDIGGPHAPYEQSKREDLYEEALNELTKKELLYPCFCSRAELASIGSAPHGLSSEGGAYPGFCSQLTEAEQAERRVSKEPALRFRMPHRQWNFRDAFAGEHDFSGKALGDFVVKRADGMFSYQLAVVVDDAAMGITDVLRGRDLLDSTPRQLALYEALSLPAPSFAHVPLIGDASGERLSKRDKSLTLASLREDGASPQRLIGLLGCLAGWLDRAEPVTARELLPHFTTDVMKDRMLVITADMLDWVRGKSNKM